MAKKSAEERREEQLRNSANIYVTPIHTATFKNNFLQVQLSNSTDNLYIGINYIDETASYGYDIKWIKIEPDTLGDLIVALAYAKHVVENGT